MKLNWERDRVAAGVGVTVGALGTLFVWWLTHGGITAQQREECEHVYRRGAVCLVVRYLPAPAPAGAPPGPVSRGQPNPVPTDLAGAPLPCTKVQAQRPMTCRTF